MAKPKMKKVFSGEIFDVYQWRQKMFDGSYGIFEILKRNDTVEVIPVTKDNKIIVTYQKQPDTDWFYCLPGGRVDKGETPLAAAKRELLEEAGAKAGRIKLWYKYTPGHKVRHQINVYIARDVEQTDKLQPDNGEKIKVLKVSFDEFMKMSDDPKFRHDDLALKMLRARLNSKLMKEFKQKIFS